MNVWVTGLCMLVFVYVFSSCSHQYRIMDFMQLVVVWCSDVTWAWSVACGLSLQIVANSVVSQQSSACVTGVRV